MEARFVTKSEVWNGLASMMLKGKVKNLSKNLKNPTATLSRPGVRTSFCQLIHRGFRSSILVLFDDIVELFAYGEDVIVEIKIYFAHGMALLVLSKCDKRHAEMVSCIYPFVHNEAVQIRILRNKPYVSCDDYGHMAHGYAFLRQSLM